MWNGLIIDRRNLFEPRRCALWTSVISLLLILRNKLLLGYYQKTFPQKHNKYLNCTQPGPKLEIQMLLICGRMKTRHEPKQRTKQIFSNTFDMKIRILRNCNIYVGISLTKFLRNFCSRILFVRNFWMHLSDIISRKIFEWNVYHWLFNSPYYVFHTAVRHCLESQYCHSLILAANYFRDNRKILGDFWPIFHRFFFANFEIILPVFFIFPLVCPDYRRLFRSLHFLLIF